LYHHNLGKNIMKINRQDAGDIANLALQVKLVPAAKSYKETHTNKFADLLLMRVPEDIRAMLDTPSGNYLSQQSMVYVVAEDGRTGTIDLGFRMIPIAQSRSYGGERVPVTNEEFESMMKYGEELRAKNEEIRVIQHQIISRIVNRSPTKVKESWPELASLVDQVMNGKMGALPAPLYNKLNNDLGLPPDLNSVSE